MYDLYPISKQTNGWFKCFWYFGMHGDVYIVKPVYKGHSIKGTWKSGLYILVKMICTID